LGFIDPGDETGIRKEEPMHTMNHHIDLDIHAMARDVDATGIGAVGEAVQELASFAREAGVSPVLVGVLSDTSEPEVARIRAISKILLALGRNPGHVLAA
jgi:hypothetical protein